MRYLNIAGVAVELDRTAAYDILTALSELHGRLCAEIGSCGDMDEANRLATSFAHLTIAYNATETVAASFDSRPPKLLSITDP